jgi:threonine dehydrogenase-like Zn-dependent dehydrogenase
MGAERVFAVDLVAERLATAARLGGTPIGAENALEEIRAATAGQGVDCVLDAVGTARTVELDLLVVRRGGSVCVVGIPESKTMPFPLLTGIARNVSLVMAACSVQCELPELFRALETGQLKADLIESLVTHDLPLANGAAAYELFDARRDGVKKVLLTP